jgi:hypothetical protein
LEDYIVNVSEFEERSINCDSNEVQNEICHRIEDEFLAFMKSTPLSENVEESQIEKAIENLINVRHPCITAPIGFVCRIESGNGRELKIVRMYLEGCSLFEVISVNPKWWTSTVKAKAIAGLVLGLRFVHSLGLIHGHLTSHNIRLIQIIAFKLSIFIRSFWKMAKWKVKTEHNSLTFQVTDGQLRKILRRSHQFFLKLCLAVAQRVKYPSGRAFQDLFRGSSNQGSLLYPEEVIHSILFWIF